MTATSSPQKSVELPKSTGYRSAVKAYSAARKLNLIAMLFTYLGALLGLGAIAGCTVVIVTADTSNARWIAAAVIAGACFWILAVFLAGAWAQAYAKHVISVSPWEPK